MNDENRRPAPSERRAGAPEPGRRRVALIAEDLDARPGLADMLEQLRRRGVPGYELELISAGAGAGGAPRQPADFGPHDFDLLHLCTAGPAATDALAAAATLRIPVCASYHADAPATACYRACALVLSPSRAADASLQALGVGHQRIRRWERGVDFERFSPARYHPDAIPGAGGGQAAPINVLYAGRLSSGKGLELLSEAFLLAAQRDPRLQLVLAGDGPLAPVLREQLGARAVLLGWLERDALARVYASADLLVFPGAAELFGAVILEAQASGLPVLAVDAGAGAELIESGRSGCVVAPSPSALAAAIHGLARRPPLRERLATGGLAAVRGRSWEQAACQLADGWAAALADSDVREAGELREAAYAA